MTFDLTAIIVHTEIAFKIFKILGTTNEINFDSLLSVKYLINRDFRQHTHPIALAFVILSPAVAYVCVFKLHVLKLKIMETCNGIKFGSKLLIEIRHQQIHATSRRKAFKVISTFDSRK